MWPSLDQWKRRAMMLMCMRCSLYENICHVLQCCRCTRLTFCAINIQPTAEFRYLRQTSSPVFVKSIHNVIVSWIDSAGSLSCLATHAISRRKWVWRVDSTPINLGSDIPFLSLSKNKRALLWLLQIYSVQSTVGNYSIHTIKQDTSFN